MTMQWMGKDGLVKFCLFWFVLVWCIGVYLGEIGADGHHVMASFSTGSVGFGTILYNYILGWWRLHIKRWLDYWPACFGLVHLFGLVLYIIWFGRYIHLVLILEQMDTRGVGRPDTGSCFPLSSPPPPLPLSARPSWYLDLRLNEIQICWENHPHFFRFWTSEKVVVLYSNLTRKIQWAVASFSKISAFFSNLCLLANGKVLSGDICMLRSTKKLENNVSEQIRPTAILFVLFDMKCFQ